MKFIFIIILYFYIFHFGIFSILGGFMALNRFSPEVIEVIDNLNYEGFYENNRWLILNATTFHIIPGLYFLFFFSILHFFTGISLLRRLKKMFNLLIFSLLFLDVLNIIINKSSVFIFLHFLHVITLFFGYKFFRKQLVKN